MQRFKNLTLAANKTEAALISLPNMVGGALRGDDKENIVLGVPSKCDQTDKWLQDSL